MQFKTETEIDLNWQFSNNFLKKRHYKIDLANLIRSYRGLLCFDLSHLWESIVQHMVNAKQRTNFIS